MGGSSWSADLYNHRAATRAATGTPTFAHDASIRRGVSKEVAHKSLDPHNVKIRESRDSDAHPDSVAIGVFFDVTGSMAFVPGVVQKKLGSLMETLLDKGYCKDPQILVGSVGDHISDTVPLQAGQFESGIEIDEQLGHMFLEGGGGGTFHESYQEALYFFARKTVTDCWEKRGKKGYLFILGDEKPYGAVTKSEALKVFGDTIEADIPTTVLIREVQERYNLFFVIPKGTSHFDNPELKECWKGLVGPENVIMLEDPNLICETIGSVIGMFENAVTLDKVVMDLGGSKDAMTVRNALDKLAVKATSTAVGMPASSAAATGRL